MQKMANSQTMTQAITQAGIEATKAVVQAMAVANPHVGTRPRSKAMTMGPWLGRSSFKQSSFSWCATDKYAELRNFQLEINNVSKLMIQLAMERGPTFTHSHKGRARDM